jgi:hypothetical protein
MHAQLKKFNPIRNGLLVIGLLGLIGCHSGQMPNAPDLSPDNSEILSHSNTPSLRIALMPFALRKSAGEQTSSKIKTKRIGASGDQITITHEKTQAKFRVPKDALDERVEISMQIKGSGASAIVKFGPDGLHFNKPARLALTFSSEGIDPENLGGYLIEEDGTHTPVPYRINVQNNRITLLIQIAHFSTYSGDGGEESGDEWWDEIDEDLPDVP